MTSELDTLLYWVREREAIRVRKELEGRPFPWTEDRILRAWRFCCVRREDDRVTRWIAKNIRERFAGHEHLWFMLCAARQINWPNTLHTIIGPEDVEDRPYPSAWPDSPSFEPREMGTALEDLASMNQKVFTGAYIVTAPQTKGATKGSFVAEVTLGALWKNRAAFAYHFSKRPTLRSTHSILMMYDGWGPFLAYQAVVDMRFTMLLAGASDVNSFTAAGPGTQRGLNRVFGRTVGAAVPPDQARRECLELWHEINSRTGVHLDLSDVPNVLCEVDKYIRVRDGQGEPRARYVPGRGS